MGAGAGGAGGAGSFLLSGLMFFPPVGADVPWRRGGGCWRSCRGLFAFYTLPCLVFLPIIWKNSSRAAAGVPGRRGGGWCSVFVEKTNKEKKTRKRVKFFIKSVDTDTGAC